MTCKATGTPNGTPKARLSDAPARLEHPGISSAIALCGERRQQQASHTHVHTRRHV